MGKRSDFKRLARDHYRTPWEAVVPLSAHLGDVTSFVEPCCGDGLLITHLERLGHTCAWASDIEPTGPWQAGETTVVVEDAAELSEDWLDDEVSHFITNPPWPRARGHNGEPTRAIIEHLSSMRPTWVLLGADYMHNRYAQDTLHYCAAIVSVGRVKWMPGSAHMGMENCAWYKFDQTLLMPKQRLSTIFYGRGDDEPVYASDIEELLG